MKRIYFTSKNKITHIQYPIAYNQISLCRLAEHGKLATKRDFDKRACKHCLKLNKFLQKMEAVRLKRKIQNFFHLLFHWFTQDYQYVSDKDQFVTYRCSKCGKVITFNWAVQRATSGL